MWPWAMLVVHSSHFTVYGLRFTVYRSAVGSRRVCHPVYRSFITYSVSGFGIRYFVFYTFYTSTYIKYFECFYLVPRGVGVLCGILGYYDTWSAEHWDGRTVGWWDGGVVGRGMTLHDYMTHNTIQ